MFYHNTESRQEHFDFTDPVFMVDPAFAVGRRKDATANGIWDIFNPYSVETWLTMGLALLLIQLFAVSIARMEVAMGLRKSFSSGEIAWQLISLQARQIADIALRSNSGRFIIFTFALLQSQLLLSLYQGWILSALVGREYEAPFNDVDQFLKQLATGEARLVIYNTGNWFYDSIMHSNDTRFAQIRDALAHNPVVRAHSLQHSLSIVQERANHAVPSNVRNVMAYGAELCDVVLLRAGVSQTTSRLAFRKGSAFTEMFNQVIAKERITIRRLYRRYYETKYRLHQQKCFAERENRRLTQPLPITPILGVVILCAAAFGFSIVILILEFLAFRFGKSRKS